MTEYPDDENILTACTTSMLHASDLFPVISQFFARALPSFSSTPHSLRLVPPHPPTNISYRSVASGYVLWTIYSPPCMCIPIVAKRKTCPPLLILLGGGKTGIYTHPRRRCEDRAARCSCHGALLATERRGESATATAGGEGGKQYRVEAEVEKSEVFPH